MAGNWPEGDALASARTGAGACFALTSAPAPNAKYRYYISSALLHGQTKHAGTVNRIPAVEIEALVAKAVRSHVNEGAEIDESGLIHSHVVRVEVQSGKLIIELASANDRDTKRKRSRNLIEVPRQKKPSTRRREVLEPESGPAENIRPIRSESRATLVASIARGRRWLDELITAPTTNAESISTREGCTVRQVNMTISLAFLAPDLVKAAIEGQLPYGMGVTRLRDLPAEWARQRQMLGL